MDVIKNGIMVGAEQGKALKALIKCASKEKSRPVLQSVHIVMHEYGVVEMVATDSYRLARYRAKVGNEGAGSYGAATIGVSDAKRVADYITSHRYQTMPYTVYMAPVTTYGGSPALQVRSIVDDPIGLTVPALKCDYPDYGRLISRAKAVAAPAIVDATLLADLVAIPAALYGKGSAVRLDVAAAGKPMTVRAEDPGRSDYYALVMPMRLRGGASCCDGDPSASLVPTETAVPAEPADSKAVAA